MSDSILNPSEAVRHPYEYMLYGQRIHSNEPLPLLPAPAQSSVHPTAHPPHLTITLNPPSPRPNLAQATVHYTFPYANVRGESLIQVYVLEPDAQPQSPAAGNTGKRYCFHTDIGDGWADCVLSEDGRTLQAFGRAHGTVDELIPYVLGGAVPAALRLRGVTCLHASAVLIDGAVVAFTGESETGKSTTMAALVQRGAHFFSDDLLPLEVEKFATRQSEPLGTPAPAATSSDTRPSIHAYPGYPRLGLLEDAKNALFGIETELPQLGRTNKRIYTPSMTHAGTRPWPIAAVYILGPRGHDPALTRIRITHLSQQAAVAALMPHTTGRTLRTPAGHANDLARIAQLARTVPVRRIDRPDDLAQLSDIAQTIYDDARTQPHPTRLV